MFHKSKRTCDLVTVFILLCNKCERNINRLCYVNLKVGFVVENLPSNVRNMPLVHFTIVSESVKEHRGKPTVLSRTLLVDIRREVKCKTQCSQVLVSKVSVFRLHPIGSAVPNKYAQYDVLTFHQNANI